MRPVKYVKDDRAQAAIGIEDLETGELWLYTDRGDSVGRGRHAATGLGYTLCTDDYIAFGDGYFIASADEKAVRRGWLDDHGSFVWMPAFTARGQRIQGISYCGGYFFVTSIAVADDGKPTCYIARGAAGGTQWDETEYLSGASRCGSVAAKPDGLKPDGTAKHLYCAVGVGDGDDPSYGVIYSATSSNGLSWTKNVSSNPGAGSYVGAGKNTFVTGGFAFSTVETDGGSLQGTTAAQANWSGIGSGWTAVDQPVPGGTLDASTGCSGAVFVNSGDDDGGYFIAVTDESAKDSVYVLKSLNGRGGWTVLTHYTSSNPEFGVASAGLSVLGKNIGKIVKI